MRQLFEPHLAALSSARRAAALSGAGVLAAPLFDEGALGCTEGDRSFAVLHGLYWLTARLAERAPLAVLVDDVHWADGPSMRFIAYLARRLEDLPVALVLAARPGEPRYDSAAELPWGEITSAPAITLEPLSVAAACILVREALGAEASDQLCEACHLATGGNPFYLRELVAALLERSDPGSWSPVEIRNMTTEHVARSVRRRLVALGQDAEAMARALAVLRPRSELHTAAGVAGLGLHAAGSAADALRAVAILAGRPADFAHPVLRSAVLACIPHGELALLHARAAERLAADGADALEIASHLLEAEPAASTEVVERLRAAARIAIAGGTPKSAVAFLRRAVREPPPASQRHAAFFELGRAEMLDRDPAARAHLATAQQLTTDPVDAGRIALLHGEALMFSGAPLEGCELVDAAIDRLGDRDLELAARLELFAAWTTMFDARLAADLDRRLPRIRDLAGAGGQSALPLLLLLGAVAAVRGGRRSEVLPLVRRGLADGRFLAVESSDSPAVVLAIVSLLLIDELDELERFLAELQADARRRGSVNGQVLYSAWHGFTRLQRGFVAEALADTSAALALAREHELRVAQPVNLAFWADAMRESGEAAKAAAALEDVDLTGFEPTTSGASLLYGRGVVRTELGRRVDAVGDLRRCGDTFTAVGWRTATMFPWRSALARAMPADQAAEARALAAAELELARESGQPRAIGRALHTLAIVSTPVDVERLRAATAELERSPARSELARALTDLGAAQRRANRRAEAREPLRRALDIAHRCGAPGTARRAHEELLAAGGRPRRMAARGTDALTPTERRVSRMATEGLSNPEIAQSLFVSRKAVEMHLSNVYRKLEIHSRDELRGALDADS